MSTVDPSSDEGLVDEGSYQKVSQGFELGGVDRLPWWDDDDSAEDARAELASLMAITRADSREHSLTGLLSDP
ncbi:hypothetical protein WJX74_000689 [Apatococcus lobatus]|uniref:Uncharacterized protein n=1 Tax=Apatococcus lobatus TaxID=904363 RepID=A0AAW1RE58_9CHLO